MPEMAELKLPWATVGTGGVSGCGDPGARMDCGPLSSLSSEVFAVQLRVLGRKSLNIHCIRFHIYLWNTNHVFSPKHGATGDLREELFHGPHSTKEPAVLQGGGGMGATYMNSGGNLNTTG